MTRYDYEFRKLEAHFQAIPARKVQYAGAALFARRANGLGLEDDENIVRQFDLSGTAEFWEIELSEPMTCVDFIRSLAGHFCKIEWRPGLSEEEQKKLGPAAERVNDSVKVGIRQALRAARSYGEPWFLVIPEPPPSTKLDPKAWMRFVPSDVVFVPPDPPSDGIDLTKLRVRPREAAMWMLSNAMRRHLVPPSLVAALQATHEPPPPQSGQAPTMPRKRGPKGKKTATVASAMQTAIATGNHTRASLHTATEESLVAEFGTTRYTCREARKIALSKQVAEITPTTDK